MKRLDDFLKQIGLDPESEGMRFVEIRNKGYLWVSAEEAEAHGEELPNLACLPKSPNPDAT